jgi:hypothetical protein
MTCDTFATTMWPLEMPELLSPISVVLLLSRTAPRAAWSALLVYGWPSLMSMDTLQLDDLAGRAAVLYGRQQLRAVRDRINLGVDGGGAAHRTAGLAGPAVSGGALARRIDRSAAWPAAVRNARQIAALTL